MDATDGEIERTAWVLHLDLDQFIAAVEVLRRPELAGKPVVVGGSGDPTQRRQVVATASYEAREFGVHSGMPLTVAHRRCPDAVFLPSDHAAYDEASLHVWATVRTFPVLVEELGWDEGFIGARTADPEALARAVQAAVLEATGLHCSIGVGDSRLRAKTATGFAKPRGVHRLTAETWMPVMGQRPTRDLWGVGPRISERLAGLGIRTVADLAAADEAALVAEFGPTNGPYVLDLGRGGSDARVASGPPPRMGRSREVTFPIDLTDAVDVLGHVLEMARELTTATLADSRLVARVAVKVREAPFFTSTKIAKVLPGPTAEVAVVEETAARVLERFGELRPVRLLGVRVEYDRPA
ncbi:DNA-directed DNA polymerase [Beutenbergia cavernae DSM 12333]|uniref:DNA-directed DNA polymerase n=1 Tax=Beutenbergia cavernae (strain ATCC BAA-8 / DSM 12333 / CCUG 43141 / JCM 11478 / NBRC 16432 / NCIMB 13614 / HKI 0122) TaxID=471853 RepID=C5C0B1_BEUC1|nr:DNA polymerase IV [Beutenbergia cavernae]ACQ79297.1 DNA-directed DNA polymerase [Beutenbergia cavernae DSM 12333]